jgi:hypothetical protein
MCLIHKCDLYPGWRALLPVSGALLLIEAGGGAVVNKKLLSNSLVIWIGLISYPLYLFHWLALSFIHIVKGDSLSSATIWGALVVVFLLTVTTYYFIERPIRFAKSNATVPILSSIFLALGIYSLFVCTGFIPSKKLSDQEKKIDKARNEKYGVAGLVAIDHFKDITVSKIGEGGPVTVFVGDSNAQMYEARISTLIGNGFGAPREAIFIVNSGTPPLPDVQGNHHKPYNLIGALQRVIDNNPRVDRVVFAARWVLYFDKSKDYFLDAKKISEPEVMNLALSKFGAMIRKLVDSGKRVTVVLSIPSSRLLSPQNLYERDFFGEISTQSTVFTKAQFLDQHGAVRDKISYEAKSNGAEIIDPLDFLCVNGICQGENEDGPIYQDEGHLRRSFISKHAIYLDATIAP